MNARRDKVWNCPCNGCRGYSHLHRIRPCRLLPKLSLPKNSSDSTLARTTVMTRAMRVARTRVIGRAFCSRVHKGTRVETALWKRYCKTGRLGVTETEADARRESKNFSRRDARRLSAGAVMLSRRYVHSGSRQRRGR